MVRPASRAACEVLGLMETIFVDPIRSPNSLATLRAIAELAEMLHGVDEQLTDAVRTARQDRRSWSEIGTMLGVSKQAAQRKYGPKVSA